MVENTIHICREVDFSHMNKEQKDMILTDRQGHPITDNQNIRTVGNRAIDARKLALYREDM